MTEEQVKQEAERLMRTIRDGCDDVDVNDYPAVFAALMAELREELELVVLDNTDPR